MATAFLVFAAVSKKQGTNLIPHASTPTEGRIRSCKN